MFGRAAAALYTNDLWFKEVGYARVFWTRNLTAVAVIGLATIVAAVIIFFNLWMIVRSLGPVRLKRRYGNLEIAEQVPRGYVMTAATIISLVGGWWLASMQFSGDVPLATWAWLHHAQWGATDPLFHRDLSFYIFTLPVLLRSIDHLLMTLFWSMVLVAIGYSLAGAIRIQPNKREIDPVAINHFASIAAAFLCMLALRFVAGRYMYVITGTGVRGGVGYTDVHARILAQWVLAVLAIVAALSVLWSARRGLWVPAITGAGALFVGALLFGSLYPALIQKLKVQPNQLERERPFIQWNMSFTRQGYGLDNIATAPLNVRPATSATWAEATPTLQKLPLWDINELEAASNQVQSFQGYYTFTDIDYDRYDLGGSTQQVGIGMREFKQDGLPTESRSWFNLHMRPEFTRGIGAAAALTTHAVGGAPEYLVGDIRPIHVAPDAPEMGITEPSVYFGELTNEYIVLGADSASHLAPHTGIAIGSFLRQLAFAWRFGDHNLLFASNLDDNSRLLFHRLVRERAEEVAPFLQWDRDALPVIENGRLQWVLDGYTTASTFPMSLSRPVDALGQRLNYIHNSVKATVDAATGAIQLYATDAGDPILRSYASLFPGLVHPVSEMPQWLRAHLRYPTALLSLQADILQQYHVTEPNAFYAGQDAWEIPGEGTVQGTPKPNEPLSMMLQIPGDTAPEFVTLLAFTARGRHNLRAMLVAHNDAGQYGKLSILDVVGDDQVKGPAQIQSLIEQDPQISQQLSLWRQLGTDVELGQLRIIPTPTSLLYVEPLFLAAQDKAIPQLARILVSDGETVAMDETLDRAIADLYSKAGAAVEPTSHTQDVTPSATQQPANVQVGKPGAGWPAEALKLYNQAESQLRAGDFAAFGATWNRLRDVLQKANAEQKHP